LIWSPEQCWVSSTDHYFVILPYSLTYLLTYSLQAAQSILRN
jgi:hypothetical protein